MEDLKLELINIDSEALTEEDFKILEELDVIMDNLKRTTKN